MGRGGDDGGDYKTAWPASQGCFKGQERRIMKIKSATQMLDFC